MKVIIADDEILTLKMLEKVIDWDKLGVEVIGLAENGKDALSIIEKFHPEILITDIKMPYMDGLELIKYLRKVKSNTKIIILSAYGEFSYVQQALEYEVAGYLLKPIDEVKLMELVCKCKNQIEEESEKIKSYNESRNIAKERIFKQLLYYREDSEHFESLLKKIDENMSFNNYSVLNLSIEEKCSNNDSIGNEKSCSSYEIQNYIKSILTDKNRMFLFENNCKEYVIIIEGLEECIESIAECIVNTLNNNFELNTFIAISENFSGIQELHKAYSDTLSLIKYRGHYHDRKIIKKKDVNNELIINNIRLIEKAKEYINFNYHKNITLESICESISISKNYFSYLFKKETGENLWDYVTRLRIEKAKELLINTNLKNYEISFKVGYENPSYLTKMFKKKTGTTPNEYRNKTHEYV